MLTRSATRRRCAALLAALYLTVATAGPIVHAVSADAGTGAATWSAPGPRADGPLHNPNACAVCLLQAGGFAPTAVQPLALATWDARVERPTVPQAPRVFLPPWRILQRPPPSSLMA